LFLFSPRHLLGLCLGLAPAFSVLHGQEKEAEGFADRWLECTSKGIGSALQRFFTGAARLTFVSQGRKRECDPQQYSEYLAKALKCLKGISRERGRVELALPETGPALLTFTVVERIETLDGFTIRAETQEEFEMEPGGKIGRATAYRSKVLSSKTIGTPESWMHYAGPMGLNGFLVEAEFYTAPRGMGLAIAGMALSLFILLAVIYRMNLRRRL